MSTSKRCKGENKLGIVGKVLPFHPEQVETPLEKLGATVLFIVALSVLCFLM